jgi:hypothetical protein
MKGMVSVGNERYSEIRWSKCQLDEGTLQSVGSSNWSFSRIRPLNPVCSRTWICVCGIMHFDSGSRLNWATELVHQKKYPLASNQQSKSFVWLGRLLLRRDFSASFPSCRPNTPQQSQFHAIEDKNRPIRHSILRVWGRNISFDIFYPSMLALTAPSINNQQ